MKTKKLMTTLVLVCLMITANKAQNCSTSTLSITGQTTDITCAGFNDGTININASGGIPPYSFIWSNNSTIPNQDNLSDGTYGVTVTDVTPCTVTATFTISSPDSLKVEPDVKDFCIGCMNEMPELGDIESSVSGGTGQYDYEWIRKNQQISANADLSDIKAGNYQLNVTDENGCTVSDSAIVPDLRANFQNIDELVEVLIRRGTPPFSFELVQEDTTVNQTVVLLSIDSINSGFVFNPQTLPDTLTPNSSYHMQVVDQNGNKVVRWSSSASQVPTMSEWALIFLGLTTLIIGSYQLNRSS